MEVAGWDVSGVRVSLRDVRWPVFLPEQPSVQRSPHTQTLGASCVFISMEGNQYGVKVRLFSSSHGVNFSSFLLRKEKPNTQTHKTTQGGIVERWLSVPFKCRHKSQGSPAPPVQSSSPDVFPTWAGRSLQDNTVGVPALTGLLARVWSS